MSDFVLSVIPTDPAWQPSQASGERMAALLRELAPDAGTIDVGWYEKVTAVDCGENLERITCPICRRSIDVDWYADLLEEHLDEGFDDLAVTAPCCGAETSLDALDFDWPVGFARFEVAVWNSLWDPLPQATMASLEVALGHPVRQILAHL